MKRVLVAMSGGVDSSVATLLLQQAGYECIGCTMKLYGNEDVGVSNSHTCCTLADVEDARGVAYRLGMRHYVFNFTERFRTDIMDRFIDGYLAGMTPNPCIDCNRYMKFDLLYQRAAMLDCDYVATGHYARIVWENGRYRLKKGLDPTKDQSYVLYPLTTEQLAHTLFPLGEMTKAQVRRIAEENGFQNADKPDSQDICFVPDGDYAAFIERATGKIFPDGDILDETGKVLGRHHGAIRYTVGQRKGLGIAAGQPLYVIGKEMATNTVTVGAESALYRKALTASGMNWIGDPLAVGSSVRCKAMTRYRKPEQWATVTAEADGAVQIVFDEPQRAVTPGQAVVLYDGDTVLGGATIQTVL